MHQDPRGHERRCGRDVPACGGGGGRAADAAAGHCPRRLGAASHRVDDGAEPPHARIHRWLVVLALAAPSCRKSTDMTADTPTGSAAGPVPTVALGHGFTPAAFTPGRYATAIQRTMHGTHALQVLEEDSTAAFTLGLAADGTATACRGWRYEFRNDGPHVHTADHYREQQGYRGRYAVNGGVAEVVLDLDSAVCPHLFEGELALARAPRLTLRCVVAAPPPATALTAAVLLCQPTGDRPMELDPMPIR